MLDLPEADLIERIRVFCDETGISATEFGRRSINDSALMTNLVKGRELRRDTRARIDAALTAPREAAE